MAFLTRHDFVVPTLVLTDRGERSHDGVVVQRWIAGRPPDTEPDWSSVATELARLHSLTERYPQRPGCCVVTELRERRTSVDADLDTVGPDDRALIADVFDDLVGVPTAVVHGDPGRSNIRISTTGQIGLPDWDEACVDVIWHDLSNLGTRVLDHEAHRRAELLSHAWEVINAWTTEPSYAARRLAERRRLLPHDRANIDWLR